jgi:hypothetical protein
MEKVNQQCRNSRNHFVISDWSNHSREEGVASVIKRAEDCTRSAEPACVSIVGQIYTDQMSDLFARLDRSMFETLLSAPSLALALALAVRVVA